MASLIILLIFYISLVSTVINIDDSNPTNFYTSRFNVSSKTHSFFSSNFIYEVLISFSFTYELSYSKSTILLALLVTKINPSLGTNVTFVTPKVTLTLLGTIVVYAIPWTLTVLGYIHIEHYYYILRLTIRLNNIIYNIFIRICENHLDKYTHWPIITLFIL